MDEPTGLTSKSLRLSFDPQRVMAGYRERRFDEVSEAFLEMFSELRRRSCRSLDGEAQYLIDVFAKHFLHVFTQEDYVPSDAHLARFIGFNPIIANVIAMSSFRSTDPFLEILKGQKGNFAKLLALCSPRNRVQLDRKALFDADPHRATEWYFCYWANYKNCCAGAEPLARLREHLRFSHERLEAISGYVHHAYFGCTYVDPENDHLLKRRVNRSFQDSRPAATPIENRPDFRKIALVTSMWFPAQSVYRCTHAFVKALAADFDLTLVHLGAHSDGLDRSLFRDVRRFEIRSPMDLSMLTPNDWGIAYFPDIGMNVESIFLANLRLAPIQICGYGHPVSTFGSRIDYWLGGRDVESIDDHERNYSERLVLVPGSGVAPNRPAYRRQGLRPPGEILLINCPWSCQTTNHPLLERLRRILDRSRRRIGFRFFIGVTLDENAFIAFKRDVTNALGEEHAEVLESMPYADYMRYTEQGAFNLDSYPFGGYATATDAIYLGKPVVAWEGTKFYNRSVASLLRRLGLDELIVHDAEDYENLALRLIHDESYRVGLSDRLAGIDLERTIFAHDDAKYVVKAFHYLVENHARLRVDGHRRPIVIDRDDAPGSQANSPESSMNQLLNRAETLRREGRLAEAEASYRQALALRPDFPETQNNLGSLYLQLGRLDDAETSFRRALSQKADFPEAHYNLAIALQSRNCMQDAAASFRQALACRPDFPEAHNDLGRVYRLLGQMEEAEASFRRAIASRPGFAEANHNLALALLMTGRLADAESSLRQALALQPDLPGAHNNLGLALAESRRLDEADQCYRRALALNPADHMAAFNLSRVRLLIGDYESGLKLYESRFEGGNAEAFSASRELLRQLGGFPRWNGEEVRGKGLLIWTEQGLGDALMVMRYLPELKARGASRIVVICPEELTRLMQALPEVDFVTSQGTVPLKGLAYHCPIMSLPFCFRTRLGSIPRTVPYLHVSDDLRQRWQRRLADLTGFKIGIAWQGRASNPRDRAIPAAQFTSVGHIGGIRLISLQKGAGVEQANELRTALPVTVLEDYLETLMDTAAIVKNLDLVITSDNVIAHLAGALGITVWVALHWAAEWRWLLGREDSPWYPTMRLFRQKRAGDWAGVFQEIEAALRERLGLR